MREHYQALIAHPAELDRLLRAGADKARQLATPFMRELRHAVGLRALTAAPTRQTESAAHKPALASFKQYREQDGLFYFKLVSTQGEVLLQSQGFAAPREAGQLIARLQQEGAPALAALKHHFPGLTSQAEAAALIELEKIKESN